MRANCKVLPLWSSRLLKRRIGGSCHCYHTRCSASLHHSNCFWTVRGCREVRFQRLAVPRLQHSTYASAIQSRIIVATRQVVPSRTMLRAQESLGFRCSGQKDDVDNFRRAPKAPKVMKLSGSTATSLFQACACSALVHRPCKYVSSFVQNLTVSNGITTLGR